ncbi:MAG TPA: hypothetical protein DCL21_06400 [Alphaproteobacteria bacterium]|nr:hypothetical protein [Alphaproteobacteria bacterium]
MNLQSQQQKISQKATKLQLQASHPESSVWVSASAGTGKTHVLTQRILRLLLNDPFLKISEVLAITFTKAAAMEMQNRLIEKLAEWVKATDSDLLTELEFLLQRKANAKDLINARILLTKVIDDSVGLNISTVHSFCETLLRKFPLEAGIPSSFTLIEDRDARKLLKKAWFKAVKQQIDTNKDLFSQVANLMGEHSLTDAVNTILNQKNRFYKMLYHYGGINQFLVNLKEEFKIISFDEAALRSQILDFDIDTKNKLKDILDVALADGSATCMKLVDKLEKVLQKNGTQKDLTALYKDIYFTKDKPRAKVLTKKPAEKLSFDIEDFKMEEFDRINAILDSITNLQNYKISQVLCILADKMFKYYEKEKLDLSYLDFNDLIDYSEKLVNKTEIQDWIRYKLDSKIKHCLIDEAQDTDMQQWNILHGIIEEFYFGQGQHEKPRTTFAVGDMKQSIYRFRGANPEVFDNIRQELDKKAAPIDHDFKVVGLHTSFRSTQAVLNFVDEVFNEPSRKVALDGINESLHHQVYKYDQAGRVEIAPLLTKDDLVIDEEVNDYEIPVGAQKTNDKLSLRQMNYLNVANKIKYLLDFENTPPKDIIVLLRNRTGMPDLIEQLTKLNIPHTGADEIYLSDSVIIDDLIAFAKFLCFENDDLSFLQILKSPAFNYSDDVLFKHFAEYKKQRKIPTFYQYIRGIEEFNNVICKFDSFKQKANKVRVFDLYLEIINSLELSEKLMADLGGSIPAQQNQVKDTIDEFLRQIEGFSELSLLSFLDWFKKYSAKIKKNTANASDAVRLMTIHGSKGLEANAIFLPDCGLDSVKDSLRKEKLLFKKDELAKVDTAFIYKTRNTEKPTSLEEEILAKEEKLFFEDDMRLLYVALTRARGEIYVSGVHDKGDLSEYSWYSILQKAMEYRIERQSLGYSKLEDGTLVFKTAKLLDSPANKAKEEKESEEIELPAWINQNAAKETGIMQERASYNITSAEYIEKLRERSQENYQYGNAVHKLLEELPKINADERELYLDEFLGNKQTLANPEQIKSKVLNILDKYSQIFNLETSFAEVHIQGQSENKKITGIVDRITVLDDKVYVIDYKTGQKNSEYILKYKQQLALYAKVLKEVYQDKQVVPAILWFDLAELEQF